MPSTVVLVKVLIVQSSFFQKLKLKPEHILNHRTPRVDWTLPTEAQTDNQLQSIIVKLESGKLSLDIILVAWLIDIVINLKVFWTFIASSQSPGPFESCAFKFIIIRVIIIITVRGIELGRASVKFFWFYYSWRQANERKFGYIAKRKVWGQAQLLGVRNVEHLCGESHLRSGYVSSPLPPLFFPPVQLRTWSLLLVIDSDSDARGGPSHIYLKSVGWIIKLTKQMRIASV